MPVFGRIFPVFDPLYLHFSPSGSSRKKVVFDTFGFVAEKRLFVQLFWKKLRRCGVRYWGFVLGLVLTFAAWALAQAGDEAVLRFIKEKMGDQVELRGVKEVEGGYKVVRVMVRRGNVLFPMAVYVDPQGKWAFLGSMVDLKTHKNLTREEHLKDLKVEHVKIDPKPWMKGPFLGKGKEKLLLVAGMRCPHCRAVVPKVIEKVKSSEKFSLAYASFSPFMDSEVERALECLRTKKADLFWDAVLQAYSASSEKFFEWLKEKGFNFEKECRDLVLEKSLPPVEGVPSLIKEDGTAASGESEIMALLK